MGLLVGLTGKRFAGKSTIANIIRSSNKVRGSNGLHWKSFHSFAPSKVMVVEYLCYLGVPRWIAVDMVHGKLKDKPFNETDFHWLPGPDARYLMEELGKFMGTHLGSDFTLKAEYNRILRQVSDGKEKDCNLIAESIVYEVDEFRKLGGVIIKVVRPDTDSNGTGFKTDEFVDTIEPDYILDNVSTLKDLETKSFGLMETIYKTQRG